VVPYVYSPDIKVCEIQWAIGLEIALMTRDHMRTFITTDHPNAGPFTRYPRIIKWLMSAEARKERIESFKHGAKMVDATYIAGMDRELSLYELAQMTRAGPAKALGLANIYGGLAPGMDADVAVYNFNPERSYKPDEIEKAFSAAAFVMKAGTPVVVDGEIVSNGNKRTLWVDAKTSENPQVMRDIRDKFLKYYSVNMNNYDVAGHFLTNPRVIEVDAAR